MSSQDNKQLAMQGYQKFQDKDIPGLLQLLADDIEWISPESDEIPFAGTYRGKGEVAGFFSKLDETQEMQRFEPRDFIAEGDKVVVTGASRWTVKSTGQTYDNPWVHVFTMRDGKVVRFEQYNDSAATAKAFTGARPSRQAGQTSASIH